MATQIFFDGRGWSTRGAEQTVEQWVETMPGSEPAPDGCDGIPAQWESNVPGVGVVTVKLCTRCGDLGQTACEDLHAQTVEDLEFYFPPNV